MQVRLIKKCFWALIKWQFTNILHNYEIHSSSRADVAAVEPFPQLRFSVVWSDCNYALMMQFVYVNALWSMAWLSLRCAKECSRLCKSLTALVLTDQTAGPAGQVCLWVPGSWMTEWVVLSYPLCQLAFTGFQWSENKGTETGSPSMMDYCAESRFTALTAGSVLHELQQL